MNTGNLKITASGDREIVMTRAFDAPRHLVFEALTKPELLKRWLLGPGGWSLVVCDIDLNVGGRYRYVWRHDVKGTEMAMGGVYREIAPPERLVHTEVFDEPWYPGEALISTVLSEQAGITTLTATLRYESRDARDGVLESPMEKGVAESYNRLEDLVSGGAQKSSQSVA